MADSNSVKRSYYLADDTDISARILGNTMASWWYDCRGAHIPQEKLFKFSISNDGKDAETGMIRELNEVSDGVVNVTVIATADTFNGMFVKLYDENKCDVVYMYCLDNTFYIKNGEEDFVFAKCEYVNCTVRFNYVLDFDKKTAEFVSF